MRRIIIFYVLLAIGMQLFAHEETIFIVGNLYYRITSSLERTVEVAPITDACRYYNGDFVIPDSVEYNGTYYKVTAIGDNAFFHATINSLVLPQNIQTIKYGGFFSAKLPVSIVLPDSLKSIDEMAFYGAYGVANIYLPASVENITIRAFGYMPNLLNLVVDTANPYFTSFGGVLYSKDMTKLLSYPKAKGGNFTIPNGVTYIEICAFEVSNIQTVTFPNTVSVIKASAFSECDDLRVVHIPASITNIEGGVFRGCENLNNFTIDSLNPNYTILNNILYSKNLDTLKCSPTGKDTVRVLEGVRVIDESAFCGLKRIKYVVLPEGVEYIEPGAFMSSNLRGITLSQTLKRIGLSAFYDCALLQSIEIPNSVTELGNLVFSGSGIKSAVMSDSVKVLPYGVFGGCASLKSYSGGNSVERIENSAFYYCTSLPSKIVFPPTLKVIEDEAFLLAPITEVEFTGIVDSIGEINFGDIKKLILVNPTPPYSRKAVNSSDSIIIPCGATQAYLSDPNWSSYSYTEDCDGIEDIDPQSAVQVVAQHKAVDVYNAENYSVAIYDLMGRCHTAEPATGYNLRHYTLPNSGVYIVRVNGKGYKVVVR